MEMTLKHVNKILCFALPVIILLGIYFTQTSNEMSGYFEAFKIKNSNDVMILSIDNSTYKQGQAVSFLGKVNHYNQGAKVHFQIVDPFKNTVGDFNQLVNRFGIFGGFFPIPEEFPDGKYLINAYYDADPSRKLVSLAINIVSTPKGVVYILIPGGSSTEGAKINFNPKNITAPQGTRIFWINNDNTVHTVISGKIYNNGTYAPNSLFKGGYIPPGDKLMISPTPGKYQYFCKLHPWLTGTISVTGKPVAAKTPPKANTVPAKTPPKSNVTPKPFAVPDAILSSIWKEQKDLQKSYPEVAKGNLTKIKNWATTTGWNQDKRLSALIPQGKVPSYLNNVLVTIWKERKDLQKAYPEVAKGKVGNLTQWALKTGWNQDQRLSLLIPSGKSPSYLDSVLVSIWKEQKDLQKSYPEVAKGNLTKIKKWATTTGWNQDKRLSVLIPKGKIPSYTENVLVTIWKERKDLQKAYPEVVKGTLDGLMQWASTTGWNQDKRLSSLIPPGKTPSYLDSVLVSIWKERKDLQKSYPEAAKGNLTKLKSWATTTGWNEDKRLSVLIPQGKIPKY